MALTKTNNRMIDGAPVNVKDFGAVGDGVTDDTAAIQAALSAARSGQHNSVFFPKGIYNVTGLNITSDINLIGEAPSFGQGNIANPSWVYGSVIENNSTSSPTITYANATTHVVLSHLKINGNPLQTTVVDFPSGAVNGTGLEYSGVYAQGADYCISVAGGYDLFVNHCYTGGAVVANYKSSVPGLRIFGTYNDANGASFIEASDGTLIYLVNTLIENTTNAAWNIINNTSSALKRHSVKISGMTYVGVAFNAVYYNGGTDNFFARPIIDCDSFNVIFPTYIYQDLNNTANVVYPALRNAWTYGQGAGQVNFYSPYGNLPTASSTVDVGGSLARNDHFFINNFPSDFTVDTINGGTVGRVVTIIENGGNTVFDTSSGNIRGNDGLPIYASYKSAHTFIYDGTFWCYVSNGDMRSLNGKRLPTSSAGLSTGQLWNDSGTIKVV